MGTKQSTRYIFVLSPANLAGRRANVLLGPNARCELATRLRLGGASLGEVFSFVSGLYFRGKLAYANAFASPLKRGGDFVFIITSGHGLIPPHASTSARQLLEMAEVPIHISNTRYTRPLERDLRRIAAQISAADRVVRSIDDSRCLHWAWRHVPRVAYAARRARGKTARLCGRHACRTHPANWQSSLSRFCSLPPEE